MADAVNQSTLKQVLLPASAAALIVVLIGVLVMSSNFVPQPAVPGQPEVAGVSGNSNDPSAEGMSKSLPDVNAPEWKPGVQGMKIWDVKEGEGEVCPTGAKVVIHYTGWTLAGKQFDSSVSKGAPANFPLTNLIQGWQIGIPGMKPGGIRRLFIPYALAYGEQGRPPNIPPKADLVFEVKLISFKG